MARFRSSMTGVLFALIGILPILMIGCGGGSGGAPVSGSGSGETGTVAVLFSDAAEDLERLLITVTEVALIPADDSAPVNVFTDPAGCEIDLLAYEDEDFLLTLTDVPTGYYEKVRLKVSHVTAEGGDSPCSGNIRIRLPSGKIDLVDRGGGGFHVSAGRVLAISLDVDVPKSINLHQAGNSGQCIFRPVVFVDIETLQARRRCPYFLQGTIVDVSNGDNTPTGFTLGNGRGKFQIGFSDDPPTQFFNERGAPSDAPILDPGTAAGVFGRLLPDGSIQALAVVVGTVRLERGIVQTAVTNGHFTLQTPVQGPLEVAVIEPLVTTGCRGEDRLSIGAIQPGFRAKVLGVRPPETENAGDRFTAVVVFLKREIRGYLREVEANGDTVLGIEYSPGQFTDIALPHGTPIYMSGDGIIALQDLQARVACPDLESLRVRVVLPFDDADPDAAPEVLIRPDRLSGTVIDVDLYTRSLWIANPDGVFKVHARYGAFILLDVGGYDLPVSVYDIQTGDTLTVFGLASCETPPEFDAYIVLAK